tara:strand:+ start:279 stop:500 length:222 start_codon:yes stop_codon:yes gene_type:complete
MKKVVVGKSKGIKPISNRLYTLLTTGQLVGLDKDLANSCEVTVVRQTPKRLYTTVTGDGENEWDVMTCRLTVL